MSDCKPESMLPLNLIIEWPSLVFWLDDSYLNEIINKSASVAPELNRIAKREHQRRKKLPRDSLDLTRDRFQHRD